MLTWDWNGIIEFVARHEEKLLLQKYGQDYRRYMQDVPMWLPRLRHRD